MPQYGLIGYPLSHSFSGKYFTDKFQKENLPDCKYSLFPLKSIEELPDLLAAHRDLVGLNVTIPYKEQIIPFLDVVSETARDIGAVNTIRIRDGKLEGFNSDVYGFAKSLENSLPTPAKGALILGTGGASKAVRYVLNEMNVPNLLVSRRIEKGDLTYTDIDQFLLKSHPLIINTTPLGTFPNVDVAPELPYHCLDSENKLYDLVYNPEKTLFLNNGLAQGCAIKNGLEMLILQAERSWEIWNVL